MEEGEVGETAAGPFLLVAREARAGDMVVLRSTATRGVVQVMRGAVEKIAIADSD